MSDEHLEESEKKKRLQGKHEEWGEIKSRILLELMKDPETRSGLKLKLNEQFKKEGYKPITIKTIVYHLRDPKKNGLIDIGIVEEKNGLLKLSLTTPRKIAKFIDELSKNKTIGPRVSYFIDRVFAEAFLSPYGDKFINGFRIESYLKERINNRLEELKFDSNQYHGLFFDDITFNLVDAILSGKEYSPLEDTLEIMRKMDLLSVVIGASNEIRGEIDTLFKVNYVLQVLNKIKLYEKSRYDEELKYLVNLLDVTVFHLSNNEIMEFKPNDTLSLEEFTALLEKFKDLLVKAISGQFTEDYSFNWKYAILKDHNINGGPAGVEFGYSFWLIEALLRPMRKVRVIHRGLAWLTEAFFRQIYFYGRDTIFIEDDKEYWDLREKKGLKSDNLYINYGSFGVFKENLKS